MLICFLGLFVGYLAAQGPTLGLTLVSEYYTIHPEGHRKPLNKVGPQILAEQISGFEMGTFPTKIISIILKYNINIKI